MISANVLYLILELLNISLGLKETMGLLSLF